MDGIEHEKRKWYVVRDTLAVTEGRFFCYNGITVSARWSSIPVHTLYSAKVP